MWIVPYVVGTVLLAMPAISDSKQDVANSLVKRATDSSTPKAAMKGAYRIEYKLTFYGAPGGPIEGKYVRSWVSKNQWRREISIPGYAETSVSDGPSTWITRKPHLYEPRFVGELISDLESLPDPEIGLDRTVTKIRDENRAGTHQQCIETSNPQVPLARGQRTLCFNNSNGALAGIAQGGARTEVSEFEDKGGVSIAQKILHFHGKSLASEADLTSLDPQSGQAQSFPHDADARQFPNCNGDLMSGMLISKVTPNYPPAARSAKRTGKVEIYAVIDIDGSIHDMEIMQSVSQDLDDAAVAAVRQWRYRPYICGGVPLRVETEVDIAFDIP